MENTKELIKGFEEKTPEIVFEWQDTLTDAHGWLVINSLRGGAAGGGTRMRKGLDKKEVTSLAKTMEIKFSICGPPIGGAKSGISFDPNDPRKDAVLARWFKAVIPILKNYYGTGGDLNVDEVKEVIPITEKYGLRHPQEGVLVGHFHPTPEEKDVRIHQLQEGVLLKVKSAEYSPAPQNGYLVADLITGWGVSEAVRHYYEIWGSRLKDKKAIIQGWGNVGAAAGWYLAQKGAKIVGIIDANGGVMNPDGFALEDVRKFFIHKKNNLLDAHQIMSYEDINDKLWDLEADIFIPAAASRLVTVAQLERLKGAGLEVISCGANVPFKDPEIFFGPISQYADSHFAVIPDFIANCGMARTFAYLMQENVSLTDVAIFEDVSHTIRKALKKVHGLNPNPTCLTAAAFQMVLE